MPEVPIDQAPSTEEVKLSTENQPPSNLELDQQLAQQQQPEQPNQVPPSEGGNVVPVEPSAGLTDPDSSSPQPEYKEGDSFSFTSPSGESYSLTIMKVEGDQVTLQNSTVGTEPVTLPLEEAKAILESPARA
jgi:hypothetical protein